MINRQDTRNALARLQDSAIEKAQAIKRIEREMKRLELSKGEHEKALQDIQDEMKELEERCGNERFRTNRKVFKRV